MDYRSILRILAGAALAGAIALGVVNRGEHKATLDYLDRFQTFIEKRIEQRGETAKPAKPIRERVVNLPEDGQAWYTTLVLSKSWKEKPLERELVAWFGVVPELASLKAQTHYQIVTEGTRAHAAEFAKVASPAVIVQDAAGKVYYKASGNGLPADPDRLANEIADCFPHPKPGPTPGPSPGPGPTPKPDGVPDIRPNRPNTPDGKPSPEDVPWLGVILAALAGAAAAGVYNYRKPSL